MLVSIVSKGFVGLSRVVSCYSLSDLAIPKGGGVQGLPAGF